MKKVYKHIRFYCSGGGLEVEGHSGWWCENKPGTLLGSVVWYTLWNQYVFTPCEDTIFSISCLKDIIDFIGQLTD